jgi:hypothetical protein
MAIEMSTQGSINSLLSSVAETTANTQPEVATQTQDTATDGQNLPSMFAALLAQLPNTDETEADQDANVSGSAGINTNILSALTSDDAISVMQNSLLSALQNNVFAGLTEGVSTSSPTDAQSATQTSSINDALTTGVGEGMFDQLYTSAFGDDGLDLQDGFDTLNIVNHLPIISDIYEATTSTHIDAAASLAGGFLYGGVAGMLYSAADLTVEKMTGESISTNLWDYGKQTFSNLMGVDGSIADAPTSEIDVASTLTDNAYQFVQRNIGD